jgi:hypothetical protein
MHTVVVKKEPRIERSREAKKCGALLEHNAAHRR